MRSENLYPSLLVSLAVHSLLVVIIFVILNFSRAYIPPASYIVNLVDAPSRSRGVESVAKPLEPATKAEPEPTPTAKKEPARRETDRVTDRIAALKAKKQIERIVSVRRNLDIARKAASPAPQPAGAAGGSIEYEALVMSRIHEHWNLPERIDKELLAIIHIRIARNGAITVDRFERKSGNPLFDKAALRAVTDASPLPAPPREMDFAVRFHP